jgi:hypothetical protein
MHETLRHSSLTEAGEGTWVNPRAAAAPDRPAGRARRGPRRRHGHSARCAMTASRAWWRSPRRPSCCATSSRRARSRSTTPSAPIRPRSPSGADEHAVTAAANQAAHQAQHPAPPRRDHRRGSVRAHGRLDILPPPSSATPSTQRCSSPRPPRQQRPLRLPRWTSMSSRTWLSRRSLPRAGATVSRARAAGLRSPAFTRTPPRSSS